MKPIAIKKRCALCGRLHVPPNHTLGTDAANYCATHRKEAKP